MESYNAILIEQGKRQSERLVLLRQMVIRQLQMLTALTKEALPKLTGGDENSQKSD